MALNRLLSYFSILCTVDAHMAAKFHDSFCSHQRSHQNGLRTILSFSELYAFIASKILDRDEASNAGSHSAGCNLNICIFRNADRADGDFRKLQE
jgi:hypothetical protein